MSFQKMYGLRRPSGLNMVNQAFIIVIAYRPRRRRRKIPGIGRYPMGPTNINLSIKGSLESKIPEAEQKYGGMWMEFWADFGFWCRSIDTFWLD